MSQSAGLYRIAATDFEMIATDPQSVDFNTISKETCFIAGTHEGFRFLLSIGRDAATVELVNQLFYPTESVGEMPDMDNIDWDEYEDGMEGSVIPYNNVAVVKALATFLDGIDESTIISLYDANELNENDVYPGAWNNDTSGEYAYNTHDLLQALPTLKAIYAHAAAEGDYVFCIVG